MRMLRQKQSRPLSQQAQVSLLTAAQGHVFDALPEDALDAFFARLPDSVAKKLPTVCRRIRQNGDLTPGDRDAILRCAAALSKELAEEGALI